MIRIKNITLGEGRPKICVPIMAACRAQAETQAAECAGNPATELVELRVDYLQETKEPELLKECLVAVAGKLGDKPLLCTLRTMKEGGNLSVTDQEYGEILITCIESGAVDILDIELFHEEEVVRRVIESAKEQNIAVLMSSHDFQKTPAKDEIVARLMQMERMGADLAKIAVMPKSREDVLTLLAASSIANTCMDIPVIAISMGNLGSISRVAGRVFGSAITFGAGAKASAPGQLEAGKLKEILELL